MHKHINKEWEARYPTMVSKGGVIYKDRNVVKRF